MTDRKRPAFSDGEALYSSAKEMQAAVAILLPNDGKFFGQKFTGVMQFLLGFSTELYLKSALAFAKVQSEARHGHDLLKLHALADELGLLGFPNRDALKKLVVILAPAHKGHSFRYMKPDADIQIVTTVHIAVALLQSFDDHLRKNIDVSAAREYLQQSK